MRKSAGSTAAEQPAPAGRAVVGHDLERVLQPERLAVRAAREHELVVAAEHLPQVPGVLEGKLGVGPQSQVGLVRVAEAPDILERRPEAAGVLHDEAAQPQQGAQQGRLLLVLQVVQMAAAAATVVELASVWAESNAQ